MTLFRAATVRERPTECRAHIVGRSLTVAARNGFDSATKNDVSHPRIHRLAARSRQAQRKRLRVSAYRLSFDVQPSTVTIR